MMCWYKPQCGWRSSDACGRSQMPQPHSIWFCFHELSGRGISIDKRPMGSWQGLGGWRMRSSCLVADGYPLGVVKNILELIEVVAAHHCECIKCHWIVIFPMFNLMWILPPKKKNVSLIKIQCIWYSTFSSATPALHCGREVSRSNSFSAIKDFYKPFGKEVTIKAMEQWYKTEYNRMVLRSSEKYTCRLTLLPVLVL